MEQKNNVEVKLAAVRKEIEGMKCPYCRGKDLYLKRTWPIEKYGCRDCEKKIKYLRQCGMTDAQIKVLFKKGATT